MNTAHGDIVEMANRGDFDVIVHGLNCVNKIKGAVAKELIASYPQVQSADDATKDIEPSNKLGTMVATTVQSVSDDAVFFTIVNAYTQEQSWHKDRSRVLVDYDAIRNIFKQIATHYEGYRIGYPKIGVSARGDWDKISKIIDEELDGFDHTLVEFDSQASSPATASVATLSSAQSAVVTTSVPASQSSGSTTWDDLMAFVKSAQ